MMDSSSNGGSNDDDASWESWQVALVAVGSVLAAGMLAGAVFLILTKKSIGQDNRHVSNEGSNL